jgi:hypothetical protein
VRAGILAVVNQEQRGRIGKTEMEFRTMSLPGAAFLVASGFQLLRVEVASGLRFEFVFPDPSGEVEKTLDGYFSGASVPARDFYRSLQDVRFAVNRAKGDAR